MARRGVELDGCAPPLFNRKLFTQSVARGDITFAQDVTESRDFELGRNSAVAEPSTWASFPQPVCSRRRVLMLRYVTSTLTVCALRGMISVFAQEQTPTQPQQEQNKPPLEAATLTGCVQEAKTTDGGTAYILNKAEGGTAALYVLIAPPPSEFATHVNHKVEVTGKVQQPSAPPEDGPSADAKVLRPPLVHVESVKPVADSCK
jgi:hypothetical protein